MCERLELAVESGVEAMAAAVEMRDDYTGAHSEEVVRLASRVGERLGLGEAALAELEFAARLHDVGKIGVPDAVLNKDGPLEAAEWEIMRQHPEWGAQLLRRVPGLKRVSRIVRHAHERWDGNGYPDQLTSAEIPLESRIILACDAYHAMTSDRPYRAALRPWVAVSELREGAGGQFDPAVIDVLVNELRNERSVSTRLFQPDEPDRLRVATGSGSGTLAALPRPSRAPQAPRHPRSLQPVRGGRDPHAEPEPAEPAAVRQLHGEGRAGPRRGRLRARA